MTLDEFVAVVLIVALIPVAIIQWMYPMDGLNRGDY